MVGKVDHTDLFGIEDISSNDLFLKAVFFFIFALARPTIQSQCFVNGPSYLTYLKGTRRSG